MAYFSFMQVYTDTFDSYRVETVIENGITKQSRVAKLTAIPCRVYSNQTNSPNLTETAAMISNSNMLCCELGYDVLGGDEIIVHRGANVGKHINPDERYIAGPPNIYVEPFGGCFPNLEHMQIALIDEHVIQ
jgi:hypothetical protein